MVKKGVKNYIEIIERLKNIGIIPFSIVTILDFESSI